MGSCCGCLKKKKASPHASNQRRQETAVRPKCKSKSNQSANKLPQGFSPYRPKTNAEPPKRKTKRGSLYGFKETDNSEDQKKAVLEIKNMELSAKDEEEKDLIEQTTLQQELKHSVKGGDSAYGKIFPKNLVKRKKSLSPSQYNKTGLVSQDSPEFKHVDHFLSKKGYQLIASIGSGNYAEVYKASKPDKNKYVAVKVIDLVKSSDNYRIKFLPQEIEILKDLKHPGIIKIYEITQTSNKIYMIMEYASNGTIADWLRDRGALTEMTAWEMFKKILEALQYMHSKSIAHRDLKLENILITDKHNPKLSDFSYAKFIDESNAMSQTYCGSLPYFSPEILQRHKYNPLMSDVWSIGVCLYVMLNDGLPFKINDEKQMLISQLIRKWEFKKRVDSKLSPAVKAFVRSMLEPEVTKRATVNALLKDQWMSGPKPKPTE